MAKTKNVKQAPVLKSDNNEVPQEDFTFSSELKCGFYFNRKYNMELYIYPENNSYKLYLYDNFNKRTLVANGVLE